MGEAEIGDLLQLRSREDLARGIVGAVEEDGPRARGDGLAQPVGIEGEARRLQGHPDGLGAGDDAPRTVVLVEGLEDDDLVARIEEGEERGQHGLRRAAAHGHVPLRIDLHAVELLVLVRDRPAQPGGAPGDGVLVKVAVYGAVGGVEELLGRGEVGHALGQVDALVLVVDPGHLPDDRFREPLDALGDHGSTMSPSIGSTLMPCWRSQATPCPSLSSGASSSSTIHP